MIIFFGSVEKLDQQTKAFCMAVELIVLLLRWSIKLDDDHNHNKNDRPFFEWINKI